MVSNIALWNRIAHFTPDDPGADFQFTDRLANENGWSKTFAKGAVQEYKRFVYLATISPTPVTPSDIVDQVWHLHLTFTQSYWEEMCGRVLKRPLHHGPTKGGRTEDTRYWEQYAQTLALYAREFRSDAPAHYWPDAAARFTSAAQQHWIDRRTHWIIRKPHFAAWAGVVGGGTLLALATASVANSAAEQEPAPLTIDFAFVGGAILAIVVFVGFLRSAYHGAKKKGIRGGCSGSGGCGGGGKGGGEGAGDGGGGGGCGGGGCGSS